MAKHDVSFSVPNRPLGRSDVQFDVWADDEKLGTLAVSMGAVVWYPSGNSYGHKVSWAKFDELMQENGRRAEKR